MIKMYDEYPSLILLKNVLHAIRPDMITWKQEQLEAVYDSMNTMIKYGMCNIGVVGEHWVAAHTGSELAAAKNQKGFDATHIKTGKKIEIKVSEVLPADSSHNSRRARVTNLKHKVADLHIIFLDNYNFNIWGAYIPYKDYAGKNNLDFVVTSSGVTAKQWGKYVFPIHDLTLPSGYKPKSRISFEFEGRKLKDHSTISPPLFDNDCMIC